MSIHIIRTKRRKQKKGDEANQGKNGHNFIKWELFYEREQVFFSSNSDFEYFLAECTLCFCLISIVISYFN